MLIAKTGIRVGKRTYAANETVTSADEAELRSRPGFSLLVEAGYVAEVDEEVGSSKVEAEVEPNSPKEFKCEYPGCDYSSPEEHRLKAHIRMAHERKKKRKR